jgi:UDP-N-acetylmuramoyl-tripeptide--D-alanyl-D-alanine ligase
VAKMANHSVKLDDLYQIYKKSKAPKNTWDLANNKIRPGDLYFAWKTISDEDKGKKKLLKSIWSYLEFNMPFLLKPFLPFIKKHKNVSFFFVDWNAAAKEALKKGANYVVIDDQRAQKGQNYLLVENSQTAFNSLAAYHRQNLDTKFIGVTGSCGKTTTKELIKSVLSTKYRVASTIGNFNYLVNLSETILNLNQKIDMAVIEVASRFMGQVREKCEIIQPDLGLITCIGKAHIENFKSIEGVKKEKGGLFDYLVATNGHIFKNLNDTIVASLANSYKDMTTFGSTQEADIYGEIASTEPFLKIKWYPSKKSKKEYYQVSTKLYGTYNLDNILAAISVGLHFDVSPKLINEAIQEYETIDLRSQKVTVGTNTIFLDAYNANPTSMKAALESFEKMDVVPKVAIIGDMLELGKASEKEHSDIIACTKKLNFKHTVFVGKNFKNVRDPNFGLYFNNTNVARKWFEKQKYANTYILLKASRGIKIERLIT